MKYKVQDGRNYISHHAIERFAERALKNTKDISIQEEKDRIGSFMERILDEHYPGHMKVNVECRFKFPDYRIELVKTCSGRIATVTNIKEKPGHDPDYKNYIKEKRRIRNGFKERKYTVWGESSRRKNR